MSGKVIEVKCPLCGNLNAHLIDDGNWWGLHVMYCDDEGDGGCDQPFAVEWSFKPVVKTYKLTNS